VRCIACSRLHWIDPRTGRVLEATSSRGASEAAGSDCLEAKVGVHAVVMEFASAFPLSVAPSHLPRSRRARSCSPFSLATAVALSNSETAPSIWRISLDVGPAGWADRYATAEH
jgi:hypothetical protein